MLYISNLMLDYYNIIGGFMKKIVLPVFFITFVVILAAIQIFQTGINNNNNSISEYIFVGVIFILFLVSIVLSIKKLKSTKQGLPEKDEMSTKIINKAASISFYISLFVWLIIIYVLRNNIGNTNVIIGYGIISMALTFILNLIYFQIKGIND